MTKAFVQNGIVTDIARVDPFTIFQPAYAAQFVDAPDDVQPGWWYDGSTFTAPPVQPEAPPQVVTMRQARLALLITGRLSQVAGVIDAIPDAGQKQAAKIEWEYAAEVRRDWPLVEILRVSMSMSHADIDDLFVVAAAL